MDCGEQVLQLLVLGSHGADRLLPRLTRPSFVDGKHLVVFQVQVPVHRQCKPLEKGDLPRLIKFMEKTFQPVVIVTEEVGYQTFIQSWFQLSPAYLSWQSRFKLIPNTIGICIDSSDLSYMTYASDPRWLLRFIGCHSAT